MSDPSAGDGFAPDDDPAGDDPAGDVDDDPTPEDLLHDARIELDQWRASFRMDPLER